jgi:hypothetical protein
MKRTTPVLTLALAVVLVAWEFWPTNASHSGIAAKTPSYSWEEIHQILEESARLESYRKASGDFHAAQIEISARLADGETTLAEATAVLLAAARRDNPEFLRHLHESEPQARSERERMALNLIRHLEQGIQSADLPMERLARLEELRAEFASRSFQTLCEPSSNRIPAVEDDQIEACP